MFAVRPGMFGAVQSEAATLAAATLREHRARVLLELGCGAGRDALFFASCGFAVTALDYTASGIRALRKRALEAGLAGSMRALVADVRRPLALADECFDAVYAHMLHSMAFQEEELLALLRETWRVLRPGGLHVFTVRSHDDPDYGTGTPLDEGMSDIEGDVIRFFGQGDLEPLVCGYDILDVRALEEGSLPKRLFHVTLRKNGQLAGASEHP